MHTHINTDKQMEYQCVYNDPVTSKPETVKYRFTVESLSKDQQ